MRASNLAYLRMTMTHTIIIKIKIEKNKHIRRAGSYWKHKSVPRHTALQAQAVHRRSHMTQITAHAQMCWRCRCMGCVRVRRGAPHSNDETMTIICSGCRIALLAINLPCSQGKGFTSLVTQRKPHNKQQRRARSTAGCAGSIVHLHRARAKGIFRSVNNESCSPLFAWPVPPGPGEMGSASAGVYSAPGAKWLRVDLTRSPHPRRLYKTAQKLASLYYIVITAV